MTKRTKKTAQTARITYPVVVTREDAKREFKHRMRHQYNSEGDTDMARFLRAMDVTLELYPDGFTVTNICRLAEPWALDARKVIELWEHYRTTMIALNKLTEVFSVLDEQMFAAVR